MKTKLKKDFDTKEFNTGASGIKTFFWYFTSLFFFRSGIMPFSSVLVFILRVFGAKIGKEVRIKPGIYIKYPWKLEIGNYSWLAECYIENLADVEIGENCCISQKAMLMTGNHNYKLSSFDLIVAPIILEEGSWVGAAAQVCPGVTLRSHAVLCMGSTATKNLEPYTIYQGNPAVAVKKREITA